MTALERPVTLLQCEVWVVRSSHTASLAERRPPVDFYDGSVGVAGHPLKDGYELRECKVAALSPPQAFHPIEVDVLYANDGVLTHKLICQFEEPVTPAVTDALVDVRACKNAAGIFCHGISVLHGQRTLYRSGQAVPQHPEWIGSQEPAILGETSF